MEYTQTPHGVPYSQHSHIQSLGSFRFDNGWILRRLNSNFIHVRMRQICPPSVLPMLQHAKGLTTVVVRRQRLVSYRHRSRPSCKSKALYCLKLLRPLAKQLTAYLLPHWAIPFKICTPLCGIFWKSVPQGEMFLRSSTGGMLN